MPKQLPALYDPDREGSKEKLSAQEADYTRNGPYPFVCGGCSNIIWTGRGRTLDECKIVHGPYPNGGVKAKDTCRFFTAMAPTRFMKYDPSRFKTLARNLAQRPGVWDAKGLAAWIGRRKYGKKAFARMAARGKKYDPMFIAAKFDPSQRRGTIVNDPAKLPEPLDFPGYDNLNNVRIVPYANAKGYQPVKDLVEGQVVVPQHQFSKILKLVNKFRDHPVELTDEDNDGVIDRIVRRGRDGPLNLFIDKA